MKIEKIFAICLLFTFASCGNNNTTKQEANEPEINTEDVSGIELFKSTDCATCHKRTQPFVGPSFKDMALRYNNASDTAISTLALSIINGSSGKWKGSVAAMIPHPGISKKDAEDMVKYILEVKN